MGICNIPCCKPNAAKEMTWKYLCNYFILVITNQLLYCSYVKIIVIVFRVSHGTSKIELCR